MGVTGSGKTFTVANVIEKLQKPTLVIAHNKTLAAQLCNEFREFFPDNAVEYFVSYYDYYQPEAYMPTTDTYIEKETSINEEIDRMTEELTQALAAKAPDPQKKTQVKVIRSQRETRVLIILKGKVDETDERLQLIRQGILHASA